MNIVKAKGKEVGKRDKIVDGLVQRLAQITSLETKSLRRDMLIAGNRVDLDLVVEVGGRRIEMLVEVKGTGSPKEIRRAADQLRMIRKSFPEDVETYLVLGAPYISEDGIEVCKEEQIGCVDAAGNCFLRFADILVEVSGKKNLEPARNVIHSIFSPRSSRVVRIFLTSVHRWWQVQEIAQEAGISIGLVSKVKRKLLEEELVLETNRKLKVRSPEKLLNMWAESYRYRKNEVREYYSLDSDAAVERRIAEYCGTHNIPYALGLFSAAARIAPHVRINKSFVFVDASLDRIADELDFKSVVSGSNVVLLKPYDAGVFYQSRLVDNFRVVSDIQAYIDLKTYKGRGEEAADFIMVRSIRPSWQRSPDTTSAR